MPHLLAELLRDGPVRRCICCAMLCLAAGLIGCAQVPRTGLSGPATGAVAYALQGPPASPVVVLQSGLGDGRDSWAPIWRQLVANHRVFALDRPGYGGSPSGTAPRDPCHAARALHAVLREAQVPAPYLLVGHSLGGLYQYVFARLYPEDVAGLLLLDPTHPEHWSTLQREAPDAAAALRGLRATLFTPAMRAEFDAQATCLDRLSSAPLAATPSRLLVSTRFGALQGEAFQRAMGRLRLDWQQRLNAAAVEAVPSAGHYIHHDAPKVVLQAIDDLAARQSTAPQR